MPLQQLSIFLENSPGRLHEVTRAFGDAGINLRALNLADTSGFGVLRLLVSDLKAARKIAMARHWPARVDTVAAACIPDEPGSLAKVLAPLFENRINVEYMYAFTGFSSKEAVMIFRFGDQAKGTRILEEHGVRLLKAKEFGVLESE